MLLKPIVALITLFCPLIVLGGDASGQFAAGKWPPIKAKHAAAYETRDQRDARKSAIKVVLSVRMVKDGSKWVFDRAVNAGLIDK